MERRKTQGECRWCKKNCLITDKGLCPKCVDIAKTNSRDNPKFRVAKFEMDSLKEEKQKHMPHRFGWVL